jgi:hypothetical protein
MLAARFQYEVTMGLAVKAPLFPSQRLSVTTQPLKSTLQLAQRQS